MKVVVFFFFFLLRWINIEGEVRFKLQTYDIIYDVITTKLTHGLCHFIFSWYLETIPKFIPMCMWYTKLAFYKSRETTIVIMSLDSCAYLISFFEKCVKLKVIFNGILNSH